MPITDSSMTDRLRELCVAGEAAYDAADLVDATGCWVEALVLCEMLIAQGHADAALVHAHLQLNLGVAWHEAFEYDAAQTQLEAAYNGYDALPPNLISPEERDGLKADVLVNVANVWNAIGHPADSAALYREAIEVYDRLVSSGHGRYALHQALARSNLANVLSDQASLEQAQSQYMAALRVLEPLVASGDRDALLRLGIVRSNVSVLMFRQGRGSVGIELLRSAHDLLSRATKTGGDVPDPRAQAAQASNVVKLASRDTEFPDAPQACLDALDELSRLVDTGRVQFSHELALCHGCVGLCDIGHQNKLDHLEAAIDLLLSFLNAGNAHLVGDLAVLYLNLGATLGSGGAIRSKVGAITRSKLLFEALRESNPTLCDYRLGHVLMGLGAAHGERGRASRCAALQEESARRLRAARAGFSDPHVVDRVLCSSLTNLGTAQRCLGDLTASLATFHDLRRELEAAIARGTNWRGLVPSAYFLFGQTFAQLGRPDQAQALFEQGLDHLARQPQWLVGGAAAVVPPLASGALLGAWRQALSEQPNEAGDAGATYRSARRAHDALMRLASLDFGERDHSACQYLATAQCVGMLASLTQLPLPAMPGDWVRLRLELADLCLVLIGSWLRRAEVDDVASFNPLIALLLPKLQTAILDLDDAALTSRWFMRTQGLRAQRPPNELLARGDAVAPEISRLWNALDQFDLETMGALRMQEGRAAPQDRSSGSPVAAARATRCALLRQIEAAGAGEYAHYLDTDDVEDRLRPDSGLLLLSRDAIGSLVLVIVTRRASGELSTGQVRLPLSSETSNDCRDDVHQIDSALYAGVSAALVRKAPDADNDLDDASIGLADRPGHEDATQRIDHLVRCIAPSVIALAQTLKHISLVPSGDLHAVPWHHFLAARLPMRTRLRVFPTVADWWRLQRERADLSSACTQPRWLIAAYDAADSGDQADRLYWINVEAELSRSMWRGQNMVQVGTRAASVTAADSAPSAHWATAVHTAADDAPIALLACGHGVAPGGKLARAGVWIATEGRRGIGERDLRLLSAGDLSGLPSVRRLLLSCCVLGRTEDPFDEPLGIMAQAFRHGAEFVLGSLVRLGDLEATLFSLAYQWALCSAYASSRGRPDWVEVFLDAQQCIRDQCWPDGFRHWLASQLPAALATVIPSAEIAHNDDDAFEARQSWHRLLSALAQEHQLKVSTPRASQPWHSWLEALAAAVALRPSTQLRLTAPWMVALGV